MATRHDDNDGSDIFWPGYVDATTNLILNLLFLLTILIVAVFMFALELGRSSKVATNTEATTATVQQTAVAETPATDHVRENIALKKEIERLNKLLAQREPVSPVAVPTSKTQSATAQVPVPVVGLDNTQTRDFEILVRFAEEAVALTAQEQAQLREALQPVLATGRADIDVIVPGGFSETKRMGFYRAMAVRNLLIEMSMLKENINVSVVEGEQGANAALVKVRSR